MPSHETLGSPAAASQAGLTLDVPSRSSWRGRIHRLIEGLEVLLCGCRFASISQELM